MAEQATCRLLQEQLQRSEMETHRDPGNVMNEWMNEVARLLNGSYDNDADGTPVLCVDPGDGVGANTYSFAELTQLFNSRISPREAADIIRMGGLP